MEILFICLFFIGSGRFSEFDAGNVVLIQIEVSDRNIKVATLARYFIKVTVRPSLTRLRVINEINAVHLRSK